MRRLLDKSKLDRNEDWWGNNIAFTCEACGKVIVVSGLLNRHGRSCPCGKSKSYVDVEGEIAWVDVSKTQ
jgi:hypothetical protein